MGGEVAKNCELLFRVDGTTEVGTGHIMRCLALAQAFLERGGTVRFLTYYDSPYLRYRIEEEGIEVIRMREASSGPSDLSTLLEVASRMRRGRPGMGWIVLDGYHFGASYLRRIREAGYPLLVIDDLAHLPFYHADIIVNQNLHAVGLKYRCHPNTRLFLGSSFVLLRREFRKFDNWARKTREVARNLLVALGGSDPPNFTVKVLHALGLIQMDGMEARIILGPANRFGEEIEQEVKRMSLKIQLLSSVKDMSELMAWADIAISAGGSTCWEMAYMGLPNLVTVIAENQRRVAEELDRRGCSIYMGDCHCIEVGGLARKIRALAEDFPRRAAMSRAGRRIVDGKGADRILNALRGIFWEGGESIS